MSSSCDKSANSLRAGFFCAGPAKPAGPTRRGPAETEVVEGCGVTGRCSGGAGVVAGRADTAGRTGGGGGGVGRTDCRLPNRARSLSHSAQLAAPMGLHVSH
ncbi:hypothetical protein [Polyangium spumosum]|uniref:Uncharacterized protein n=1 Tax=Polyangium spumosum TaxID=889282 RepID=A0A6N7PR91_9BACT|nr:hypothetical protein [Polyangium spumosum]MRG94702.1 hypothetical protein [Polyangium spumosum]